MKSGRVVVFSALFFLSFVAEQAQGIAKGCEIYDPTSFSWISVKYNVDNEALS